MTDFGKHRGEAGRKPRIVHVYKDVYPPVQGGIERTIGLLARLTRDEFDVRVIVAARGGKRVERMIEGDVPALEVPSYGRALSAPIAPGFFGALGRSGADLFHFHVPNPTGEIAYLLSGNQTPAVATYHSDVVRQKWAMGVYGPLFRGFLSKMKVIMPTSQRYLETSEWLAPHRERCQVVPLGLPLEEYAATPGILRRVEELKREHGDYVLFLGCLRAYKGIPFLLEAMRMIAGAKLLIAGDGTMGKELKRMAAELGVGERVRFLGRVEQEEAVALLRAAAVVALPSHQRSEAFGLVQIEAMACGTPVVSTDLPTGVPEVNADGVTGLVVRPGDPHALSVALGKLLGDAEMRKRMGEAGIARANEKYTAERMARDVAGAYREVLAMTQA